MLTDQQRAQRRTKGEYRCPIHNVALWLTEDDDYYCPQDHADTVAQAVRDWIRK